MEGWEGGALLVEGREAGSEGAVMVSASSCSMRTRWRCWCCGCGGVLFLDRTALNASSGWWEEQAVGETWPGEMALGKNCAPTNRSEVDLSANLWLQRNTARAARATNSNFSYRWCWTLS